MNALDRARSVYSPRDHDDEVHDVPHVSEVAARVENEALRQYLEARLHREYAQEVGLGRLLKRQKRQDRQRLREKTLKTVGEIAVEAGNYFIV